MIRITARLFAVSVAFIAFLPVAPLHAASLLTYVSATGTDGGSCTAALPCRTVGFALQVTSSSGQINCLDPQYSGTGGSDLLTTPFVITIDCPGVVQPAVANLPLLNFGGTNEVVKIRNLTISGSAGGYPAILFTGSGTLILENCVFENFNASGAGPALDIEPTGPFNLVITNSRISNNAAGVLIQPGTGGSVTATLDGVTIVENNGGGLKTDTINGPINLAISNSTISKNGGNGINAVGSAGGQNVLQLTHDVIAYNSVAGVQANGASAAVLVNNTSILNNATGATSLIANGRILTYGNNSIVGLSGSGFTGNTSLQ
jgi:hypothetical protein